ncbi:Integral membrane protein YggT, involved in response to extracytoplasmic stress (osmotic shock) [Rhodovulum sp. P5]|uniref:YggT family protein n=1 Tax=Rhodovulum sp. P5 TaxID=1564506 RepID=UPI0009C2A8C2|nr:YggT family protein [Rhodovulum sp. P5]ARE40317.1 Integral membrane protein YggT, involved in response to extracytoplasmic stress (osmotic shock) [Rhodovulum sp. P5]
MLSLFMILLMILNIVYFIIIVQIIMSWLISFNVLNVYQPIVGQIWRGLNQLLEPIYSPVRRILPNTGSIDLAPLVVLIAIFALKIIIGNNMYIFA